MAPKLIVALLLLLPVVSAAVCSQRPREVYVKAGQMVALLCPQTQHQQKLIWTSHVLPEGDLELTGEGLRRTGLLVHGKGLLVLNASVSHQGNYSCSLGNRSRRLCFRLTVLAAQSPGLDPRKTYSQTCFTQNSCTLRCPDVNTPAPNTPNMTENAIVWHKVGESSAPRYISSVEERDGGVYTCTRSYLHHGQMYNMSYAVVLDVQPGRKTGQAVILSPRANDVFHADLGSALVIDCQAVSYSEFDDVFWLIEDSFVDTNESLPVYYNYTSASDDGEMKMTASLVFRAVSAADLSRRYTCKLESDRQPSTFVTISLAHPVSFVSLETLGIGIGIGIGIVIVATLLVALVFIKLKKSTILSQRDTCVCCGSTSDGKSHDVLLVSYESDAKAGMTELDRTWMKSTLEETFGCVVYDCGALKGKTAAAADVLSESIEQSQTVILVPTSSEDCLESGLLGANHVALMKQKSRLVLIRTESTPKLEELQLPAKAGHCVTWKGTSSRSPSSSFWKELQDYLPPPQQTKMKPLLQTLNQHDNREKMDTHHYY